MQSYVFIAGGIGITPFRSMLMDLLHNKKSVPITLFYCVPTEEDILFRDIISKAEKELHLTFVPVIKSKRQKLTKHFFTKQIPDYQTKYMYVSGSQSFVLHYQEMLLQLGVPQTQIKIDSFTGYN